jgi:hypothetical protein
MENPVEPAMMAGLHLQLALTVRGAMITCNSTSKSKRYLRWLVEGSSTYCLYAFVAFFLAALISSLI